MSEKIVQTDLYDFSFQFFSRLHDHMKMIISKFLLCLMSCKHASSRLRMLSNVTVSMFKKICLFLFLDLQSFRRVLQVKYRNPKIQN